MSLQEGNSVVYSPRLNKRINSETIDEKVSDGVLSGNFDRTQPTYRTES